MSVRSPKPKYTHESKPNKCISQERSGPLKNDQNAKTRTPNMQTKGRRDTLQNPRTQQTRNTCEARVFGFGLHSWVLLSVPPAIVLQRTRSVSESGDVVPYLAQGINAPLWLCGHQQLTASDRSGMGSTGPNHSTLAFEHHGLQGGFCRLKHRHRNTDPKIGPGG